MFHVKSGRLVNLVRHGDRSGIYSITNLRNDTTTLTHLGDTHQKSIIAITTNPTGILKLNSYSSHNYDFT